MDLLSFTEIDIDLLYYFFCILVESIYYYVFVTFVRKVVVFFRLDMYMAVKFNE